MQRAESLIRAVRVQTNNEDYEIPTLSGDPGSGIQNSTIARHLTAAQRRIHGLILDRRPSAFVKEAFISTIAGQEAYTLPLDAHVAQSMLSVEYANSSGSQLSMYSALRLMNFKERDTSSGQPGGYIARNGSLLLNPIPQSSVANAVRINYQYDLPDVNCRVGVVDAVNTGISPTSLTVALYANDTVNGVELNLADYVCIVDKDGNQALIGSAVMSYVDSGAFPVLTINLSLATISDNTLYQNIFVAKTVTGYVVVGKNATTHSQLNDFCEDYLVTFASWRLLKGDSNALSMEAAQELQMMEQTIVEKYAQQNDDIEYPAVISDEYWS